MEIIQTKKENKNKPQHLDFIFSNTNRFGPSKFEVSNSYTDLADIMKIYWIERKMDK